MLGKLKVAYLETQLLATFAKIFPILNILPFSNFGIEISGPRVFNRYSLSQGTRERNPGMNYFKLNWDLATGWSSTSHFLRYPEDAVFDTWVSTLPHKYGSKIIFRTSNVVLIL